MTPTDDEIEMPSQPLAICRVKKIKTMGELAGVSEHHARTRDTPNADPGVKNPWMIGSGDPRADWERRVDDAKVRFRRNGVLAIEVVLSASPAFFRPETPETYGHYDSKRLVPWARQSRRWLQETFGADNLVSLVLHLDERTPHLQAVVVPFDPATGRLNASRWLDGRERLSKLQDSYHAAVADLGVARGIKGSRARHTTLKSFYASMAAAVPAVPGPTVDVPPPMATAEARAGWARRETERIARAQAEAIRLLSDQARAFKMADRKRREYQETAKALEGERDALARQLGSLRDIPMAAVAQGLGFGRDQHQHHLWRRDGRTLDLKTGMLLLPAGSCAVASSLELVTKVRGGEVGPALEWLVARFGPEAAAGAYVAHLVPLARASVERMDRALKASATQQSPVGARDGVAHASPGARRASPRAHGSGPGRGM